MFALGAGQEATVELSDRRVLQQRGTVVGSTPEELVEERRRKTELKLGRAISRPAPRSGEHRKPAEQLEQVEVIKKLLLEGLPPDRSEWTAEHVRVGC